jgi:hypothetical protein
MQKEGFMRGLTVLFMSILLLVAVPTMATGRSLMIGDFSGKVDSRGIPQGWELKENTGKADFKVECEKGHCHLRMSSENTSWTLVKTVDFDIREYPILTWRWKVTKLPQGGDVRKKDTDDQAGQLYVQFPRFPEKVRSQIIGYIWDATVPKGTILDSPSENPPPTKIVVVESGEEKLGQWVTEKRNVYEDYRNSFGDEVPPKVQRISLWINTQHTKSTAECFYDDIVFQKAR